MKIVIFELEPWERGTFQILDKDHDLIFESEPLDADKATQYADTEIISTFIYSHLGAEILRQFPNLRFIATRSTGVDHIDREYCANHGITICNVPSYGCNTVAEHVFALLLTISHKMTEAIERVRLGNFSLQGLQGFDISGKTMGVIGTGDIGRCVIKIAKGFGMNVLAYDIKPDDELSSNLGFNYVVMDKLLSTSDIITLHVPANDATYHMISSGEFQKMKTGAIVINTSRGPVIDIQAMLGSLAEGRVAAAGLDVLPEEPVIREEAELLRSIFRRDHDLETLLADHVLIRMRNVYITPHNAFNTKESIQRILDVTMENITTFLSGEPINTI